MKFIDERILNYSVSKSNAPSELCQKLEAYTKDAYPLSHMMSGPLENSLLGFLIRSHQVKKILEIGTFTGYSALAMAEQLPEDGSILTIDKNKKVNSTAKKFWGQSKHGHKIEAKFGHATEVIPSLEQKFDLIFIDADKRNYLTYLKLALTKLSKNGLICIDNVLWSGRVIEGFSHKEDKSTQFIIELNDYVSKCDELYGTLLPIRDGLFLIQRK